MPAKKKRRVLQRTIHEEGTPAASKEDSKSQSELEDMPGCSTDHSEASHTSPDVDEKVTQLVLMNASLHKLNEHLQQQVKRLLTQPQRLDVGLLNSTD